MKYYLTLIFCNENSAEYLWFYLEADYHHPSKDTIFDHPCFITKLLPLKTFFLESKRASSKKESQKHYPIWILIANKRSFCENAHCLTKPITTNTHLKRNCIQYIVNCRKFKKLLLDLMTPSWNREVKPQKTKRL